MYIIVNWDTSPENPDDCNLPENPVQIPDYLTDTEIADYLSEKYGWCVNGWSK